ncbi:hypothetical protein ACQSSU_06750 [Micromonospora echinospora]
MTTNDHLRGPWLAVLADHTGDVYPTFALAADVLVPETQMNIRIVRGSAMPVGDDDYMRLADEYDAADEIFEIDAPLIDDDYPSVGAQARYAQAKAMADGLNHVGEVDRLRAELEQTRAVAQMYREVMVSQHEWIGHVIYGNCEPCNRAADEADGSLACSQSQTWQREYEDAIGTYLPQPAESGASR